MNTTKAEKSETIRHKEKKNKKKIKEQRTKKGP
jgi:hypothetical protein